MEAGWWGEGACTNGGEGVHWAQSALRRPGLLQPAETAQANEQDSWIAPGSAGSLINDFRSCRSSSQRSFRHLRQSEPPWR